MKYIFIILFPVLLFGQVNKKILFLQNYQNATVLNGSSQYWVNAAPDSFTLGGYQVLMMARVKQNAIAAAQGIVAKYKSAVAGRSMYLLVEASGVPTVYVSADGNGNANRVGAITAVANKWTMYAGTYTPSALNIYTDGVLSNGGLTGSIPAALFNPVGTPLTVGVNGSLVTGFFNGLIAEVQVVRFTTLPADIAQTILRAHQSRAFPTSYDGGEVIFHTRWRSGGNDISPKNNNLTPVASPTIVRIQK